MANLDKYKIQPTQTPQAPASLDKYRLPPRQPKKGILASIGEFATDPGKQVDVFKNLGIGAAKEVGSTLAGMSSLGEKAFRALGAKGVSETTAAEEYKEVLTKEGTAQEIGGLVATLAMYLAPGGATTKLAGALERGAISRLPTALVAGSKTLPKVIRGTAGILSRAATEAGATYGITGARKGEFGEEAKRDALFAGGTVAALGVAAPIVKGLTGIGKTAAQKQDEARTLMRDVLGHGKALQNFAKRRKVNLDDVSTFLAKEGAVPDVVDAKLNWDKAITKFSDEVSEVGAALDSELAKTPRTVSWSWKQPLNNVLSKIDDITDNAAEAAQAKKFAVELLDAEKARYGGNPSMQNINRVRSGMWQVGYEHGVPGSALKAKVGRLLGHEIGEAMKVKELSGTARAALARMTDLSRAVSVLDRTAGLAVKGGRVGTAVSKLMGGMSGAAVGGLVGSIGGPIGSAAGVAAGTMIGGAVSEVVQQRAMKAAVVKAAERAAKLFQQADSKTKAELLRAHPMLRTIFDRLLGPQQKARMKLNALPMGGAALAAEDLGAAGMNMVGKADDLASKADLPLSDIAESTKSGGFTYDPKTNLVYEAGEGILGDTGIMVSAYPERTRKILADSPDALRDNPEVIAQFRQALIDNADLLSKGKHKLGGWYSHKDKAFVLDVVVRVPEEFADDAAEIARVADQEGGFKVSNAEYIPYGGSGGTKAQGTFDERAAMVEEKMKKWSKYDNSRKGMVRLEKPEEIPSAKNLTDKDLKVEARAKKMAIERQDEIIADYRKNNPNIVNSDDYRDYFEKVGYNGSNSNAVHESVSYLANRDFAERVLDPKGAKNVILLAGGPGSGKGATLGKVPEIASSMEGGAIIWDGVLGSSNSMKEKIGLVRKGKKSPIITVIIRNPYAAHQSTIDRFLSMKKKKGYGRVVPTRITAEGLLGAKGAGEATDALGGKVRWISNLGEAKDVHLSTIDEIAKGYPKASQEELKKAFDKATMERTDLTPEEKAAFTESVLTKE
jgi:uncharacterized protein YcfJ